MTPDDYPSSLKTTTVFFSPGNEQAAATVAAAFGNSKVERVTGIGTVVQVVLGPDFSSVSTPPPSGSSVSMQISRNSSSPPTRLPEDLTVTNAADTTCEYTAEFAGRLALHREFTHFARFAVRVRT